jgi:hypothetical protein
VGLLLLGEVALWRQMVSHFQLIPTAGLMMLLVTYDHST